LFDEEADVMDAEANMRKAIRIQAKISTIVAAFSRIRQGKEPVKPKQDLGFAANFLYMLKGKEAEPLEVEIIDKALIIHADHELNAYTFTARVSVAKQKAKYYEKTSTIGTLKGPLHCGANENVMKMLVEIGTEENAITNVKEKLAN